MIKGKVKTEFTLYGKTHKVGEYVEIAKNLGLEDYLEKSEFKKVEEKEHGNYKTDR